LISAIIIENEKHSLDSLKEDLKNYCPQINVVGDSATVAHGVKLITELKPQLVFLDIELDDGSGFDLLKALSTEKTSFKVIFVTSHNEFAIQAFRFSAIDYLLKPVDADDLVDAVKKVEASLSVKNQQPDLTILLDNIRQQGKPQKIALATGDSIMVYKIETILRCESQRNYTMFHFENDKPLLVSKTMKEYEELLSSHGFERVHNSHLINMSFVKRYVKSDGGYIEMTDGANIPVAQAKKEQVVKILSGK
jgi:two-component system LytT family response regulator